jgi:hypothetical protein
VAKGSIDMWLWVGLPPLPVGLDGQDLHLSAIAAKNLQHNTQNGKTRIVLFSWF